MSMFPKDFTLKIFGQDMIVHVLGFSGDGAPREYRVSIYPFTFITTLTAAVNGNIGAFGGIDRVKVGLSSPELRFEVEIQLMRMIDMIKEGSIERWIINCMYNDLNIEAIRRINK